MPRVPSERSDAGAAPRSARRSPAVAASGEAGACPPADGNGVAAGATPVTATAAETPPVTADATDSGSEEATAAGRPRGHRRRAARLLVRRTLRNAWDDDIFSESASAAFWQTLSLPPLLLGIFGVLGYVGGVFGPDTVAAVQQYIVDLTADVFSREAIEQIIVPTVADILSTARAEVVSVGFLISFWSGSSAMSAFVDAITRAHDQYEVRNLVWQRVLSMIMYLIGLVTGIIALPLVALGPDRILRAMPDPLEPSAAAVVGILYYPAIGGVLLVALTTLYKVALPLKPPWHRGLPGAALAAVVFLALSAVLRAYLNWLTGTGFTYGALAAPIAFLLATFAIALAIILGAHLNASIQALWPARLRDRRRRLERSGPGTPELRRVVGADPESAAAVLEALHYEVRRPDRRP